MYKVVVKQYFDHYLEWERQYREKVNTKSEAEQIKKEAEKQYYNRPLVQYIIDIVEED